MSKDREGVVRHTISFSDEINTKIQNIRIKRMQKNPAKNVTFTEIVMELVKNGLSD